MQIALALLLLLGGGGKIDWTKGQKEAPLLEGLRKAKESKSVLMVYFTADW